MCRLEGLKVVGILVDTLRGEGDPRESVGISEPAGAVALTGTRAIFFFVTAICDKDVACRLYSDTAAIHPHDTALYVEFHRLPTPAGRPGNRKGNLAGGFQFTVAAAEIVRCAGPRGDDVSLDPEAVSNWKSHPVPARRPALNLANWILPPHT